MRALALVLLFAACKDAPPGAVPPPPDAGRSCLDAELERRGLNPFGDPPDTVYAGGTPLFDEKSGKTQDRTEYVRARNPAIARACPSR